MHFHSGKKLWFSPKRVSAKKKKEKEKKNHSFNHKPNRRSQAGQVERKRLFHQDADQPENRMHYTVLILTQNKPRSLLTRCFSTLIAFCSVSPSEEALLSLLLNATAWSWAFTILHDLIIRHQLVMEAALGYVQVGAIQDISQKREYHDISDLYLLGLIFILVNTAPGQTAASSENIPVEWWSHATAAASLLKLLYWYRTVKPFYVTMSKLSDPFSLHRLESYNSRERSLVSSLFDTSILLQLFFFF